MVRLGMWTWYVEASRVYGIPVTNYIGWFIISATIYTIYLKALKGDTKPRTRILPLLYLYETAYYLSVNPEPAHLALPAQILLIAVPVALGGRREPGQKPAHSQTGKTR